MPVKKGSDAKGEYYRWGKKGKKYHFKSGNKSSETRARKKALLQSAAAHAAGYQNKGSGS